MHAMIRPSLVALAAALLSMLAVTNAAAATPPDGLEVRYGEAATAPTHPVDGVEAVYSGQDPATQPLAPSQYLDGIEAVYPGFEPVTARATGGAGQPAASTEATPAGATTLSILLALIGVAAVALLTGYTAGAHRGRRPTPA